MVTGPAVERPSAPAPAMLAVDLLGAPRTSWDGRSLTLPRRQLRALLYRLAATAQPVPREQLCFLFWPDLPEATARRNLIVLLHHLRRALPAPDLLVTSSDAAGLSRDVVRSDAVLFDAVLAATRGSPRTDLLCQAVDLYRGPFLDGFVLPAAEEFEAWLARERETWERRYLGALSTLIDGQTARGEYAAAIGTARRYLATDELAEEVHRRLIALYAVTGDRTAALRQFEHCAAVLERELRVRPDAKTRAVYEAVRAGLNPLQAAGNGMPPPRATARAPVPTGPATLPAPPSALIGRVDEVAAACALLERSDVRLMTLCGSGGSGKTRLAIEVARQVQEQFADGVVFVPLASLRNFTEAIDAVAHACGLQEWGPATPVDLLCTALREKHLLLVLDNYEHLLAAAPAIAELLAAAPRVSVLVTSRVRLNLSGEHALEVPPLPLPDPGSLPPLTDLAEQPAVALLVARARAADPALHLTAHNAADLAAICVRLDGLPLAIELAAARLKLMSPRALLERLDHPLTTLPAGPRDLPERQRTLRATIEWSERLLEPDVCALFARLAVFAGGWTLTATEAVCGEMAGNRDVLDGLQALVDAHLLTRTTGADGELRFGMLETVREYALERLETSGAAEITAQAHALYFAGLAEQTAADARGAAAGGSFRRLDADHANLLKAIDHSCAGDDRETALRLASALGRFWLVRGYVREGRTWLNRVLDESSETSEAGAGLAALRARAHGEAGELAMLQGDYAAACRHFAAAVDGWRSLGRKPELAVALMVHSAALSLGGDRAAALDLLHEGEALAEAVGDPAALAMVALCHGYDTRHAGRFAEAREWLERSLVLTRDWGDPIRLMQLLVHLIPVAVALDDAAAAGAYAAEMQTLARDLGSASMTAFALNELGEAARTRADYQTAGAHYAESLRMWREMGDRSNIPRLLHNLGYVALHENDAVRAEALFQESLDRFRAEEIERGIAEGLAAFACLAVVQNRSLDAARLWGAAEALRDAGDWGIWPPDKVEYDRYLACARTAADPVEFSSAWQEGRGLTLEQVLGAGHPAAAIHAA